MAKRKEAAFSATQLEQLRELYAQARLDNAEVKVPKFEYIENYTDDELQAAINKAVDSEGAIQFWCLMNAFDAFIEKRRRRRGWGLSYTP